MKFQDSFSFFSWLGRRFWEGRQFYSSYIALFISGTNWITIQYQLLLGRLSFFDPIVSNIWIFGIAAAIIFSIISILGGHYIHRKRQFRLEQSIAVEENPYLYRAAPGKERELMIPLAILQVEALEAILKMDNSLTEEKKKQFESYKQELVKLARGGSLDRR